MSRRTRAASGLVTAALSLALTVPGVRAGDARPAPPLPTESARWVGEPASWGSLRGKVTLVFVWTFG